MSFSDEYFEYVVNKNPVDSKAKEIAFSLLRDATDRRGWRQEWDQFDEDVQEELMQTWINIIEQKLNPSVL